MSSKEFEATTGAAVPEAHEGADAEYLILDTEAVVPGLTNPREDFNKEDLAELAESIKTSGIVQPILVRPLPGYRLQETFEGRRKGAPLPTHETVYGERRYRATILAGVAKIPVLSRKLTNDQVREIQMIENLHRKDLRELEEAEGIRQLMELSHMTADDVAAKLKRSKRHVWNRVKLLELIPEARAALQGKKIEASIALVVARIPNEKLQKKALTEALRAGHDNEPFYSVRTFESWARGNVMQELSRAQFSITDASLHATAGSCAECPKRTGSDPELYPGMGANICTDPKCFEAKASVHRARLVAKAETKGLTVIEGKEAKQICGQYSTQLKGYSRLDQKRTDIDDNGPSLRKLLGKDAPSPVLIENPFTKELIEAVPTAEAEAVLVAKGVISKDKTESGAKLEEKIEQLKEKAKFDGQKAGRRAMFETIKEAVRLEVDDAVSALITADLVRTWMVRQVEDFDAAETLVEVLNLTVEGDAYNAEEKTAVAALQRASDANVLRALVLFMASDEREYYPHGARGDATPALNAVAAAAGLDLDGPREAAISERKLQLRNELAELKAKHAPKAPPADEKPKKEKKSSAPPAAQRLRARKPTAEEVQAKIAEEWQALDQAPNGAEQEVAADAAQEPSQAPVGAAEEVGAAPAALAAPTIDVGDRITVTDSKYTQFELQGEITHLLAKNKVRVAFEKGPEAVLPATALQVTAKALWPFPTESHRPAPAVAPAAASQPVLEAGTRIKVRGAIGGYASEHHGKEGTLKEPVDGSTKWIVNLARPKKAPKLVELEVEALEVMA